MKWIPLVLLVSLCGFACRPKTEDSNLTVDPRQIGQVDPPPAAELIPPELIEPEVDYPDGLALRVAYKPGEVHARKIRGEIQYSRDNNPPESRLSGSTTITLDYSTKALAVEDGIATVEIETSRVEATSEEGSSARDADRFELNVNDRGQIVRNLDGILRSGVSVGFVPFPKSRVKPGSEWGLETYMDVPIFGAIEYVQKFIYRGERTVRGTRAWQVDTSAEGGDKISIKGTYYFDRQNGQLIEASFTLTGKGTIQRADGGEEPATVIFNVNVTPAK